MIKMIVAVDRNFGIGYNGELLFRVSEDLKRFKYLTLGEVIVMGRKTYESLPKVLPYRHYMVLTSNPKSIKLPSITSQVFTDVDDVVSVYANSEHNDVWVIGGAEIYKQFLPYTDEVHITHIDKVAENVDTYFPYENFHDEAFLLTESESFYSEEEGCKVTFAIYR